MKSKKKKLRIQKLNKWDYSLLVSITLLIMLVMSMLYIYTDNAKKSQVDLIYEVMEQTAENQKEQFETFIAEKIHILQALVSYPDIYGMDIERQDEIIKGRASEIGFNHMFVIDTNGLGYYFEDGVIRDQSKDRFFHDVMNNDIFITQPFYTGTEVVIMTACVSIYDDNGNKVGVLCGAINLESVQQLILENEMILEGTSYILNEEGRFVTSKNHQDVYYMKSIYNSENSDLSLVKEAFAEKEDKEGRVILDGITYRSQIAYLENYNWVILQIIPEENITERFMLLNMVQYALSFMIFVMIMCMVRIIFLWRRSDKKIYTDPLTGCHSRAACVDMLDSLEHRIREQITIVYMDLNKFKWVNDTFGHDKGDKLLILFAEVLERTLGECGFVGRMGGDEFIAILADTTEAELLDLWKKIEELLILYSKELDIPYQMSSSYGYAVRQKGEQMPLSDLLKEADKKMYDYKVEQKKKEEIKREQ